MKKRLFAPLLALCLALSLVLPASAALEYGLVFDETEMIQQDTAETISEYDLTPFQQEYGIELRIHLLSNLDDRTLEEYAKETYKTSGYGDADTQCGLLLAVKVREDDNGLAFEDYTTYASDALNLRMSDEGWTELNSYLELYLNGEAWEGDLASDDETFAMVGSSLVTGMQSCVDNVYLNLPETAEDTKTAKPTAEPAAESTTTTAQTEDYGPYVRDDAGLLTEEEVNTLEEQAKTISAAHQCGVYILTVNDFTADGSDTIRDFAKGYYKENDLGWGESKDGELLVLSMSQRKASQVAYGDKATSVFIGDNQALIEERFKDNFKEDDWAGGFADYLTTSEELLKAQNTGDNDGSSDSSYDGDYTHDPFLFFNWKLLGICVIVSCVIALVVCLIFKAQMKSARIKTDASDYVDKQDIQLRVKEDRFTHRTESRVRIHDDDDHGGGGVDSDGFTGRDCDF